MSSQLASFCFVPGARVQTNPELVQFRLTHHAGKPQNQAVVIGPRVIEPFAVGDENSEDRAQVKQLIPVAVVASHPRSVKTDDQANLAEADIRNQRLKAEAILSRSAALAEVIVDDPHPVPWPTQVDGAFKETILQVCALAVSDDLAHRGLADVDIGQLGAMRGGHD